MKTFTVLLSIALCMLVVVKCTEISGGTEDTALLLTTNPARTQPESRLLRCTDQVCDLFALFLIASPLTTCLAITIAAFITDSFDLGVTAGGLSVAALLLFVVMMRDKVVDDIVRRVRGE
jgi:hypothetical protein